jgi:SAM-dependent methyltransferase
VIAADKQERLAKVYDAEVLPVYAARFAEMLLRALPAATPAARVVEIGCATGHLTLELARRFDDASRITAYDEAPPFLEKARAKIAAAAAAGAGAAAGGGAGGRVTLELSPPAPLPLGDGSADLVVSNLAVFEAVDPRAAVVEAARVLAPGGQALMTGALRGTWIEFLDIYRDVLQDNGKHDSLAALDRYVAALPDGDTAARWFEEAGLVAVEIAVDRWEILFRSAREFFFAPLIELGPLSRWKQLAGRGEEMQDVFFFTKEAIDAYFKGTAFPITVVGATVKGRKAGPSGRPAGSSPAAMPGANPAAGPDATGRQAGGLIGRNGGA